MSLHLVIRFSAPVHHGTGSGIYGIVDRAVHRTRDGVPFLSGSAIKGKLRHAALQLLAAESPKLNESHSKGEFCPSSNLCMLCEVFGSPARPAAASFGDAFPPPNECELLKEQAYTSSSILLADFDSIRASTAISRYSRTAEKEHLFTTESVPDFLVFKSPVYGSLSIEQRAWLRLAAKLLTCFGAGAARGLGFCSYTFEEHV